MAPDAAASAASSWPPSYNDQANCSQAGACPCLSPSRLKPPMILSPTQFFPRGSPAAGSHQIGTSTSREPESRPPLPPEFQRVNKEPFASRIVSDRVKQL